MKNTYVLFLALLCSTMLNAQSPDLSQVAIIHENGNWVELLPDTRIEHDRFFEYFQSDLGLGDQYHFELMNESTDALGFSHYRYQENYNGYPVEGGIYILHVKDNFVSHANGKLVREIPENGQVAISPKNALQIAKNYMGSELFYWEIPEMEARIKHIKNDPEATFLPEPELVFAQSQFTEDGENYKLTWKYEIYAAQPEQMKTMFVDVSSGDVLFHLEGLQNSSVEAVAETRYHGTQTIITDSISPAEYRLIDATRGGGIETYDMNENVDDYDLAVDFIDEDNYWDLANEEMDDAAIDAHWGTEMLYDYFLEKHGRDSYDGNGSMLVNYIHYDEGFFNAFWNGLYATFGDGNNNPLTSIDVVAHEYSHGVTGTSAGLVYLNESGALNESFSDIFGTAVEFFALQDEADWLMGKENFTLRNLSNPNAYNQPDTYNGDDWFNGPEDNGGVHYNSGVQNFWFYLLSNGGTGMNDNGDEYAVDSLGMDKAAAIAYRNLTVYLSQSSTYMDARIGALQSAEDLYGTCSFEVLQVAKAWHAVGLGSASSEPDLQVVQVVAPLYSSCSLGSEELISMTYRFNPSGCGLTMEAGEEIEFSYRINMDDPIVETIVLTETLNEGDLITYEFQTSADLSEPDQYMIDYKVSYMGDLFPNNDEIANHNVTNPEVLGVDDMLAFDNWMAVDSVYVVLGSNAEGEIKNNVGVGGSKAFQLNGAGASVENTNVVLTEDDNFTANPNFISKVCSCVDLDGWNEAYLNFDLRQTLSPLYLNEFGFDLSFMIAARVTINDFQIGEQYHPQSNNSDPYLSHQMDVSDYAGTAFTLCFEGVHFVNDFQDEDGIGDKSLFDNIYFSQTGNTGLEENQIGDVAVYPNPTTGLLNIEVDETGMHDIDVIDVLGNTVQSNRWNANGTPYTLNLSGLAKGTYILSIKSTLGTKMLKVQLI